MSTMRGVCIGLVMWFFALFLFFVILGGMGLFGRETIRGSVKRDLAEADGGPFEIGADSSIPEAPDQMERQSSAEFRRWASQEPRGSYNATRPSSVEGTTPQPMTDLSSY